MAELDASKARRLDGLDELILPDRVHGSLYTDPAIFAAELERIWYRTWVYVGHVSEIPAPDAALLDEGIALARELAAGPTRALGATKRLLWTGLGTAVEQCLADEARTVSELSGTADAREGLAAVIERRTPRFTGR